MNAKFAQLVPEGQSNIYYAWQQKKFKYRSYKAAVFLLVLCGRKCIPRSKSSTQILRPVSEGG